MAIVLLGLNHKSATVEIRERVAFSKAQIKNNAQSLRKLRAIEGIAILSTCNRTEFYLDAQDSKIAVAALMDFIARYSNFAVDKLLEHMYIMEDKQAVEHLFTVAGGLDSMILGESQIQGQVQDAYRYALEFD